MNLELGPQSAFLLRRPNGGTFLCDGLAMLRHLLEAIAAGKGVNVVHELRPTLRWRVLPKREIRELARLAHYDSGTIELDEFLTLDFWYK